MATELRDGSIVSDNRLGRIYQPDQRNRSFHVRSLASVAAKQPRSYTWACGTVLDQGNEGSCVGHGWAHELIANPVAVPGVDHEYAVKKIYWPAQQLDGYPGGAYPGARPFYEGTSVLAGAKAVQKLGLITGYTWAYSLDDMIMGVGYQGPAVIGVNWYEGMIDTETNGRIRPVGEMLGGHCVLINGVNLRQRIFKGVNSWGRSWGIAGAFIICFDDMENLLIEDGECCFAVGRKK